MRRHPRIVVIGGGTGSYTALIGLKRYTDNITAVVSMADDGGSSGRLRDEFGHLPPGDIRRCLLALSSDESASVIRQLFEYRFDRGIGLDGHSFGNLILTALTELTGRTDLAILQAAKLLQIRGTVLPVTLSNSRLCAKLADGTLVRGECNIDLRVEKPAVPIRSVFLEPAAIANPVAVEAIQTADAIVIGPGDLYTSVVPNLLVRGIPAAIQEAAAAKIYVCNLMTKHGETDGFKASHFVAEIQRYVGGPAPLDHVIVNAGSEVPHEVLARYARENAFLVEADLPPSPDSVPMVHYQSLATTGTLVRHDSTRLAEAIMRIVAESSAHVCTGRRFLLDCGLKEAAAYRGDASMLGTVN